MSISHLKCNNCYTDFEHRFLTSHDDIRCPECNSTEVKEQLGSIVDTHVNITGQKVLHSL